MTHKETHIQNRFLIFLFVSTLTVFVLWLGARNGQTSGVSEWIPKWGNKGVKAEPLSPDPQAAGLQDAFAKIGATLRPAVVSITAVHVENVEAQVPQFYFGDPFEDFFREFYGDQAPGRAPQRQPRRFQRRSEGMGSGVIVDPRGYVLTNEHVVRGADKLTVTVLQPEEVKYEGKVVGSDPRSDLAVIKISPKGNLVYAALGDSDKIRVGDWAVAMGSPFGLQQTLTVGVISALHQTLNIEGRNYTNLLQTDAAINRGNSGGPLINIRGEVIGINTAIYAPTGVFAGVGFAIPSNFVKDIMNQLIEKGRVVRSWMGVEIIPLNEVMARQFGLSGVKGVLVNSTAPGSPAEKAGIRRGDVITRFNGTLTPDPESLTGVVSKTPPKTKVAVSILRDGEPLELSLVTAEMPAGAGQAEEPAASPDKEVDAGSEWEGARLSTLTPDLARRYSLPNGESGVVVMDVQPGGWAEKLNLMEGDLITSFNRAKTPDVKSFKAAAAKADLKKGVLLDVFRRGRWIYISAQGE